MMTNYDELPDELQQQQQQQQQSTLTLLYLPIELAEEISLYFEVWNAVKLLRVSRSFHNLFLPRVWADLHTFIVIKDDEARQLLLEKYGHFVRIISSTNYIAMMLKFDWLPFVKNATHLKVSINYGTPTKEVEMLMELIKQSKIVQILNMRFDNFKTSAKYDEFAAAINGLKYLKCITCEFGKLIGAMGAGSEWMRAASFVDLLHPSVRSKLRLKMYFKATVNEMNVQTLAPYVVQLKISGKDPCTADLVDKFFCVRGNDGQRLMFPQLKELTMISCCLKSENYGVKSITASRLPQLQRLYFWDDPCHMLDRGELNHDEHEIHNWQPEYSGYVHIIIPSHRWHYLTELRIGIVSSSILMDIVDLNPQLRLLIVGSEYTDVQVENDASKYNHDVFQLDTILNRLPHLVSFSIERLNSRIVVNPAAIPMKRRYNMQIFIACQMSIAPSATAYIMQIPHLTELTFNECVFMDIDETIQLLQSSPATCGVKRFQWYPVEWNQDLALAMTNKMPRLKWFTGSGCPKEHRAIFEAKCVFRG